GTTTTPFDMVVLNDLDRFHLAMDVIDRVPWLARIGAHAKQAFRDRLIDHGQYIRQYGDDPPEIKNWRWGALQASAQQPAASAATQTHGLSAPQGVVAGQPAHRSSVDGHH